MVLTNTLLVGLACLLVCLPQCTPEQQRNQSLTPETTTTSVKIAGTVQTQSVTSTTQKPLQPETSSTSKPKTDVLITEDKSTEQKSRRGSTKYADTYTTTTDISTIPKLNLKNARQTTVRSDRSLIINTDKYNSPEYHSENNIYSESQVSDKKFTSNNREKVTTARPHWEVHIPEFSIELTTIRNEIFDNKYKKVQEDIMKSLDAVSTTGKYNLNDHDYKQIHEGFTTPKNEAFDNHYKKMQEDISKSLDANVDKFFDESRRHDDLENLEKPQPDDAKLDYTRYRSIEAIESKDNNKIRKDYNDESGSRMKQSSDYNKTQIIDAPGIVANTIPNQKYPDNSKKIDLDEGETKLEKIIIEKPEKDPSSFINNKIENDLVMLNLATTEGPEERPFEHRGIYLSKRGSTIQNREPVIDKTLSTDAGIPHDLFPVDTVNLTTPPPSSNVENNTVVSKNVKKEKNLSKSLKKELEIIPSDIDNKIPKFLSLITNKDIRVETTTSSSITPPIVLKKTTEIPDEASTSTTEIYYTESTIDDTTTEKFESMEETSTTNFFEITDSSTSTEDTTIYAEMTSEQIKFNFTEFNLTEEIENINAIRNGDGKNDSDNIDTDLKGETTTESETVDMGISGSFDLNMTRVVGSTVNWNITEISEVAKSTADWVNTTTYSVSTEKIDNEYIAKHNSNDTEGVGDENTSIIKKNETIPNIINEITKPSINTSITIITLEDESTTSSKSHNRDNITDNIVNVDGANKENTTDQPVTIEPSKKNEISVGNADKVSHEDCDHLDGEDYGEIACKNHNNEENNDPDIEVEDNNEHGHLQHTSTEEINKITSPTSTSTVTSSSTAITETTTEKVPTTTVSSSSSVSTSATTISSSVVITQQNREVELLTDTDVDTTTKSDSIIGSEDDGEDGGNAGKIAAIVISTIGGICLLLLVTLLIIMKKRQKRFNYGQRCRPVSLDAYSMDNVSIHNSARRKGVLMASKRSYGNPAFEDPTSPTHLLNFTELLKFNNNQEAIKIEFDKIPQVTTKTNELPEGCDVKNRYANVIPLPETRVFLSPIEGIASSDYINANYVTGPQGARHYYIACQAPMQNTIEDFWRMIWEQQSKVVLMLTHLYENGVEKCIDYLPPSEVLDCHRLFGDYQVTLKKREVKDKYIISSLQLKNMVSNSWREVIHLWYMGWPVKGVPDEANSLIAFLLEARSCMKGGENKIKETNNSNISNGLAPNLNPVVVHCSPGTGRTGTVVACDIAIREFELTRKVDIPRIVYRIRRDRASAVQTKEQYGFIYKVINFYASKLTGAAFDSF